MSSRLLVLLTLSLVALMIGACGSDDDSGSGKVTTKASAADPAKDKLAQIRARGTLVEYFEPDYPPQSIAVKGATRPADTKCADNQLTAAEVTGYDNEVPKLIAEKLGVEACFVSPSWTG
jgi:polar amino acid transport system substrate-binding protein